MYLSLKPRYLDNQDRQVLNLGKLVENNSSKTTRRKQLVENTRRKTRRKATRRKISGGKLVARIENNLRQI